MTTPKSRKIGQERLLREAIAERRANPSFDGSPVPDEVLSVILRAGLESPSGYNLQPWRFVVVRTAEQKRRLREAAMGQPKVEEAGAVIVCCGDPDAPRGRNLDAVLTEAATEWLRFPQARIHMSQRFQPVERKDELDTVRLLWPKRAVIVEYGDVFDPLGAYYSFAAGMNPAGGKMHCQAVS